MSSLREVILSRKISMKSMSRHFAGWKEREFTLDKLNRQLIIQSLDRPLTTTISLISPDFSFGNHYYSTDPYYWLWIKYFDNEEKCMKEVIMKFEFYEKMELWEKELNTIIRVYRSFLRENNYKLMNIFEGYIKEQANIESITEKDDGSEGQFFASESIADDSNGGDDLSVSFVDGYDDSNPEGDDNDGGIIQDFKSSTFIRESQLLNKKPRLDPLNLSMKSPMSNDPTTSSNYHAEMKQRHMLRSLLIPRMTILIMVVGTRGDVQPFTELALRLKSDGHRVRVATHDCFRNYISEKGLEFYPLAGDPMLLSEFMVKTQGCLIPTSAEIIYEVPKFHNMLVDIVHSCWKACVEVDPKDERQRAFIPDAIISNPVTYAHIHCAEALGVPLHMMFPQPWTPTKAFPHPLSCLSYQRGWCAENYLSYQLVDRALWMSLERDINAFRVEVLGLEPLRMGQGAWNLLNIHQVPFVKMWSPTLVPKPKDWPDHVDIVGAFSEHMKRPSQNSLTKSQQLSMKSFHENENHYKMYQSRAFDPNVRKAKSEDTLLPVETNTEYEPTSDLANFLSGDQPIIYVGFGSMVVKDIEKIISLFLEAAAVINAKILIQIGWSLITPEKFMTLAQDAQYKASVVRETEKINSNMAESLIFPSKNKSNPGSRTTSIDQQQGRQSETSKGRSSSIGGWLLDKIPFASSLNISNSSSSKKDVPKDRFYDDHYVYDEHADEWDEVENDGWTAQKNSFFMGPCPHHWLFERVTAVVHHGGAGTTSTGLVHGCSTWICPFFGDQHFWGEMVYRAGLGPKPCSVHQLTLQTVIDSLELLVNDKILRTAKAISECMRKEDGVEGAVHAFYKHLPLENMLCDVSLFKGEYRLAQVYCKECNLKMSSDVSDAIHQNSSLHLQDHIVNGSIRPCCYVDWTLPKPTSPREGIFQGLGGFVHELTEGVADAVYDPVKGIYNDGIHGAATGLVTGLNRFVNHQITGGSLLYERFKDVLTILSHKNDWSKDDQKISEDLKLQEIKSELAFYSHTGNKKSTGFINHDCSAMTKKWRLLRLHQNFTNKPPQLLFSPVKEVESFEKRSLLSDGSNNNDEEGHGRWFNHSSSENNLFQNQIVGLDLQDSIHMEEINLDQPKNDNYLNQSVYDGEITFGAATSTSLYQPVTSTTRTTEMNQLQNSQHSQDSNFGPERILSTSIDHDGQHQFVVSPVPGSLSLQVPLESPIVSAMSTGHHTPLFISPKRNSNPSLPIGVNANRSPLPEFSFPTTHENNNESNNNSENNSRNKNNLICHSVYSQSLSPPIFATTTPPPSTSGLMMMNSQNNNKNDLNSSIIIPAISSPDRLAMNEYQYYSKIDLSTAYKQSIDAWKLFQRLNRHKNRRSIPSNILIQLLHYSIARDFTTNGIITSNDPSAPSTLTKSSSLSMKGKNMTMMMLNERALSQSSTRGYPPLTTMMSDAPDETQIQDYFIGNNPEEIDAQIQSFVKMMTRNKRYLDFIDFALLYVDILKQATMNANNNNSSINNSQI